MLQVLKRGLPGGSLVKNPPLPMQETRFDPCIRKIPEKKNGNLTNILAWKSCEQRSAAGHSPWGQQRDTHDSVIKTTVKEKVMDGQGETQTDICIFTALD